MGMLSYLKRTLFLKRTHRLPESGIRVLFVGSSVVFSNPLPVSMGMFFFWKLLLFLLSFVFLLMPPPPQTPPRLPFAPGPVFTGWPRGANRRREPV